MRGIELPRLARATAHVEDSERARGRHELLEPAAQRVPATVGEGVELTVFRDRVEVAGFAGRAYSSGARLGRSRIDGRGLKSCHARALGESMEWLRPASPTSRW